MKLLLDSHLLLWLAEGSPRLSAAALELIADPDAKLWFSAASLWEIAIKRARGRPDFETEPSELRLELLGSGFSELPVTGDHAVAIAGLADIHGDPFDRILLAQAVVENLTLVTTDAKLAAYPGPIRRV